MSLIVSGTTHWGTLVPFMVLLGLGLGFNFQPVILAVQNAVSPREIGVATSSVTFFRQMGGTIGTAAFLSILFSTLGDKISSAYGAARSTTAFQEAAAAHPDQLKTLSGLSGGGSGGSFGDTSFVQRLAAPLAAPFKNGFADSIDLVFLVAAGVVAIGFFVMLFLPQLELRNQSGMQARAEGGSGAPADATPAETATKAAGAAAPTSVSPANAPAAGDGTRGDGTAAGDGGSTPPADGSAGDGPRHGRHEAPEGVTTATGLASIPADHLPEGVQPQGAGRPQV
jgi:hypothetical protein